MTKPIKNATELKPIVEKPIKALYGQPMENIKIMKADQFPLFREPRQGWLVHAEFNKDKKEMQQFALDQNWNHTDFKEKKPSLPPLSLIALI